MNKKRVLSLLLALVMVFGAFAPTISMAAPVDVYVKVVDDVDNAPVAGAVVKALDTDGKVLATETVAEDSTDGVIKLNFDKANYAKFVVEFRGKVVAEDPALVPASNSESNPFTIFTPKVVVEGPGQGGADETPAKKAEMVPFQIVDQNNHVLLDKAVKVTKLEYRGPGANAWTELQRGSASEDNYWLDLYKETGRPTTAYRLLTLNKANGFEDGKYRVTFGVNNRHNGKVELVETEFVFEVKDGEVVFTDAQKDFFRIDIDVVVKQFNYKLRVVDCELNGVAGREFDVYAVKKNAEGKYVLVDNKPVADDTNGPVYTLKTNRDGFAGLDYEVNPDGSVTIEYGTKVTVLDIGTQLVIVDKNDKENRQFLNLWKLKDEVKYQTTPIEKILEEPVRNLEARKDAHNTFIDCEKQEVTLRVRVETMPFTSGEAKPVPGAKVEVGLPKAYAYGTALEWGETVATGVTDKYGYVEFSLPVKKAVRVWGAVGTSPQLVEMTMPYLVRQVDNGNNEGVRFNDTLFIMENDAQLVAGTNNVYELIIRNNVDLANRLGGANRYETAVKMAERLFPNGLQVKDNYKNVVVASGESYPDALTATTTAYNYNAPLLLVGKDTLPEATAEYLKANGPTRIVIVGGNATISPAVEKELEAYGLIKRISGKDRYATSVANAHDLLRWIMDNNETKWVHGHFGDKGVVYMASGENFPDALAAASPAAVAGSPLLLTAKNFVPQVVKDFIVKNKAKEVRIIGGAGSVSDAVLRDLRDSNLTANRISGSDRSATSVAIANEFFQNANHVFVTSGAGYADALTGATLAAKEGSPVLLLPNADTVSDAVKEYLENNDVTSFTILGGTGTVSEKARTEINNIILGR